MHFNRFIGTVPKDPAPVDPCPVGQHTCRNGQCIPSGYGCDGERDCDDDSDEDRCIDTGMKCVIFFQHLIKENCCNYSNLIILVYYVFHTVE